MKHVVLLTHGHLAEGFVSAVEVISGTTENQLITIAMEAQDSIETIKNQIDSVLRPIPKEDSIILLTDIPVGSTTQCVIPFLATYNNLYLLTGLNLGLLLEVILNPNEDNLAQTLRQAVNQSQQTLLFINDQLDSDEE